MTDKDNNAEPSAEPETMPRREHLEFLEECIAKGTESGIKENPQNFY